MVTGLGLISRSLRLCGALATSAVPTADEGQDALVVLNAMLAQWEKRALFVYAVTRQSFAHVAGTQTYTIGVGGTWNTARPSWIEAASREDATVTPAQETPVYLLTDQEYQEIALKAATGTLPDAVYYRPSYPLGIVTLFPVPTLNRNTILYLASPLENLANLAADIDLPPEYEEALVYNLAVRLAPEFAVGTLSPLVVALATEGMSVLRQLNKRTPVLTCEGGVVHVGRRRTCWPGWAVWQGGGG